jgi:hypothetical protein
MNYFLLILAFTTVCLLPPGQAEDDLIPQGFPPERYEPLWKKSPFSLSSVAQDVPGGFAEKFILTGILKIGDTPYADVLNKETKERMFLSAQPNPQDIRIEKLESGTDLSQVVVTLRKGNEVGVLRYDQEYLKQTLNQAAPPMPANPAPMAPRPAVNPQQPPPAIRTKPVRRIIVPSQA